MQAVLAQKELGSTDYKSRSDDSIYAQHILDKHPDFTDEEVAAQIDEAKALTSYVDTVEVLREKYVMDQDITNGVLEGQKDALFNEELESQRHDVVAYVEEVGDIAGAPISIEQKEFLLHDIMELNDNKDPILMEKIFSDPETMFKTSWFINYGEDYISGLNNYWKRQVSLAGKAGYNKAVNGMTENPTIVTSRQFGGDKVQGREGRPSFGKELTEEELFDVD